MLRRRAEVLRHGLPYLTATIAGRPVGYAYASPYRARSAYRFSLENYNSVVFAKSGSGKSYAVKQKGQ